jgi:uncharacterized membrane protein
MATSYLGRIWITATASTAVMDLFCEENISQGIHGFALATMDTKFSNQFTWSLSCLAASVLD